MNRRQLFKLLLAAPVVAAFKPFMEKPDVLPKVKFVEFVDFPPLYDPEILEGEWVLNPEWSTAGQHGKTIWLADPSRHPFRSLYSGPPPKA
jgi:hypothetical protein